MMNRVVITGIGAITSLGTTRAETIMAFDREKTGFERCAVDNELTAAPVPDFDLKSYINRFKNRRYLTRGASFALAAAVEAARNSGICRKDLERAGLFTGAGPNLDMRGELPGVSGGKASWKKVPALWLLKFLPNTPSSAISQYLGIRGESQTLGTACAASLQAIGQAYRMIRWGMLDTALAGGGDSRLSPGGLMAYKKAGALNTDSKDPGRACRPFNRDRAGFVCGEGGAFFLLEEKTRALKRNAVIHAEILGFGATSDGHAMTAPAPDGQQARAAVEQALHESGGGPESIGLVSAHGTGTRLNDRVEADMLSRVFRNARPAVTGSKSWIGHLSAACGAAELALALYAVSAGFIPPVRNLVRPCSENLAFATSRREVPQGSNILIENFGFGGQNAAMVLNPWTS